MQKGMDTGENIKRLCMSFDDTNLSPGMILALCLVLFLCGCTILEGSKSGWDENDAAFYKFITIAIISSPTAPSTSDPY